MNLAKLQLMKPKAGESEAQVSLFSGVLRSLLARKCLVWQDGTQAYLTKKGKTKAVLSGLVQPSFWREYKSEAADLKAEIDLVGAWLVRVDKGQWELLVPLNPKTVHVCREVLGYELPTLESQVIPSSYEAHTPLDADNPF